MEEEHDWLHTVIWTVEAHFTLSGAANTHNCRVWTAENPHAFVKGTLQQPKVSNKDAVYCGAALCSLLVTFSTLQHSARNHARDQQVSASDVH
ncbi:transposable element tc3 transposase [Trichonephila inaurata madagascariensis]|uniref:Transposable element tc3 transposase n=1 Tax=Trichonephila inaurata madagascariensis TaxID=2747483 RepID=A0A8X6WPC5_9ARAC|nr:transposable element tc3 transposase [Trichonephila inaurata madagascariensis]